MTIIRHAATMVTAVCGGGRIESATLTAVRMYTACDHAIHKTVCATSESTLTTYYIN